MAAPLHPDCLRLLEMARAANRPAYDTLTPAEARAQYAAGRPVLQPPPPELAEVREIAGKIPLRLYHPAPGQALPGLVFLHGGGWVFGDLDTHDYLCRSLALQAGCAVLSVGYRLAPEHPFPAAVEDAAIAWRFAHEHAAALGMDAVRLAVGGDSAGGNLAAVVALLGRDGALPAPMFQLLLYPGTDMAQLHDSYIRFKSGLPLVASTMAWFRGHYAPDAATWSDWRASPLRAPSLSGVAPAYVLTAGHDPLCDEGRAYAARLEAEGVRVTAVHAADQMHGFVNMGSVVRPAALHITLAAAALRDAYSAAAAIAPGSETASNAKPG